MFGTCSLDEWRWAYNMVLSRSWKIWGFVPYFDFANHHFNTNMHYSWDSVRRGLSILAWTDISVGNELNLSYGQLKSNSLLFGNYGFFLPNTESKTAILHVSLKDYHPDHNKKAEDFRNSRILELKPRDIQVNHPDNWDWYFAKEAFDILRILTQKFNKDPNKGFLTHVTLPLEVLVLKELIDAIHSSIGRMKSSLQEDEDLLTQFELQGSDVDTRMVDIVKVRIEERNVLLDWKNLALDCLMMLKTKTLIRNSHNSGYLDDIIYPLLKGNKVRL